MRDEATHCEQITQAQAKQIDEKQNMLTEIKITVITARSQLHKRNKRRLNELWTIFPILEFLDRRGYSISDIYLLNSENFEHHVETMASVGVGYVSQLSSQSSDR